MGSFSIYYIHGANSSDRSFNYLRQNIKQKHICANYSTVNSFYASIEDMKKQLDSINDPIFIVGHSLGGIYALHLSKHLGNRFLGAVTLSTPFAGSKHASSLSIMYPWITFYKEISPTGGPVVESQKIWNEHQPKNWTQIVSTKGRVPIVKEDNDGVVTIESMEHHASMPKQHIEVNHYEVLQDPKTLEIITKVLKTL